MIQTFADREAKRIFKREGSRRYAALESVILRKLLLLHSATKLMELVVPPGNRLEALAGDRRGQYSIRINQQYRLCFRWEEPNAFEVEITDYHQGAVIQRKREDLAKCRDTARANTSRRNAS